MRKFYFLICSFLLTAVAIAQNIVWNFGTTSPNPFPTSVTAANVTVTAVSQGNNNGTTTMLTTSSPSSGYAGASGLYNAGVAARTGALNTAPGGSAYFEFTLTPDPGYRVTLSSISFGSRSTSTGPQAYSIMNSSDNYVFTNAAGTFSNTGSWTRITPTLAIPVMSATGTPVTIRIYGHNGTGNATTGTANWRIDDLSLTVTLSAAGSLPVHFSPLRGAEKWGNVQLEWTNFTEMDILHYAIERSDDGQSFIIIDKLNPKKNDGDRADYLYEDARVKQGNNIYRIKAIEKTGKITFTNMVRIHLDASKFKLKLYPNPVSGSDLTVQASGLPEGQYRLKIHSLSGAHILSKTFMHPGGSLKEHLPVNHLLNGVYYLQIDGPSKLKEQFIKQ